MFFKSSSKKLLIVVMLIGSLTMTGCKVDADLSKVLGSVTKVVNSISGKLADWLSKGVEIAKGVVDKIKDFAKPIIEKGKDILARFKPIADKLKDGVANAKEVFDDVGNVVKDLSNASKKDSVEGIVEENKDAIGSEKDGVSKSVELVANPADEANDGISHDEDAVEEESLSDKAESSYCEEKEDTGDATETDKKEAEAIKDSSTTLIKTTKDVVERFKGIDMPSDVRKSFEDRIAAVQKTLKDIAANPNENGTKDAYAKAQKDVEKIVDDLKAFVDKAKGTVDGVTAVVDGAESAVDEVQSVVEQYKALRDERTRTILEKISKIKEARVKALSELKKPLINFWEKLSAKNKELSKRKKALAFLKAENNKNVQALQSDYEEEVANHFTTIEHIKADIEKAKKIAALEDRLNKPKRGPFGRKFGLSSWDKLIIQSQIRALKAKGPKESVAQLQVKLYEAEKNANDKAISAAKKRLEDAKAELKASYEAKAAELEEVIAEKEAEVREAAKQLFEARAKISNQISSVEKKYDDMLKEQNAELEILKEEIRKQRKEALDKLKELNSTGVK